ncbi:carbohydrate ABC transporter permease [Phytoactinopolyspora limicola]|uniref:carbohydrate ABC transporter permease n=1 Tax=Phytoactinopolyspora limicola TaxID=2715536 RepID=UPI001A9C4B2A|nr:carbohydrate ABC transporter permease [Phytoactinopolyspora limicola]
MSGQRSTTSVVPDQPTQGRRSSAQPRRRADGKHVQRLLSGYLPLLLAVVVMMAPLIWMLISSVKTRPEIFTVPLQWLPERPYGGNYTEVIERYPFGRFFLNSVIVTAVGAGVKVLLAMFTAYALVFIRFPAKKLIFILIIVALMVPPQVVIVPNYTLIADLGWQNTYLGIIVPGLGTAFGTFLLRQQFLTLPRAIVDAATLDGAGHWRKLWHVVVPISAPTIATVALVTIVSEWNEYLWPLIIVDRPDMMTLPVALTLMQNADGTNNWGVLMAGTAMVVLPVLVVFTLLQRHIVAGLTQGATTG